MIFASYRVATVRANYLENEIFLQVSKKSGNFVDGQGNLERTWKVRVKSGNLKINEKEVDRRRSGKTRLKNGQEWTVPAQQGQLKTGQGWKGIVASSSVVPQGPSKVMG